MELPIWSYFAQIPWAQGSIPNTYVSIQSLSKFIYPLPFRLQFRQLGPLDRFKLRQALRVRRMWQLGQDLALRQHRIQVAGGEQAGSPLRLGPGRGLGLVHRNLQICDRVLLPGSARDHLVQWGRPLQHLDSQDTPYLRWRGLASELECLWQHARRVRGRQQGHPVEGGPGWDLDLRLWRMQEQLQGLDKRRYKWKFGHLLWTGYLLATILVCWQPKIVNTARFLAKFWLVSSWQLSLRMQMY